MSRRRQSGAGALCGFLFAGTAALAQAEPVPAAEPVPQAAPVPAAEPVPAPVPTTIGPGQPFTRPPDAPVAAAPPTSSDEEKGLAKVHSVADRLSAALRRVKNAECKFTKDEWKDGEQLETSVATLRYTARGDVYLKFQEGPNTGREILFRPGKNDDKLLVSNPIINLSLEPDSYLALRHNRHTVHSAGMHFVARRILKDHKRLKELPQDTVRYADLGRRKIGSDWAACYVADSDKKRYPELYAEKTEICVSERIGLPIDVRVWQHEDGKERVVGHYRYEDCKTNVLSEKDFDPENEGYGF